MSIALTALPAGNGTWVCSPPSSPTTGNVNVACIMQGAVAIVHTRASWPTGSSSMLFSRWTGCFAHSTIEKHAQRELPDTLITTFVFISL